MKSHILMSLAGNRIGVHHQGRVLGPVSMWLGRESEIGRLLIHASFALLESAGKSITLPKETFYRPHPEALEWHRKERFGAFLRE